MANNKMLIDASHPEETRVAMVRGNRVDEFDFESEHKTQLRGNIYLAKVTRVEPSLQAAFVDYGGNRHGFLAFNEIHPDYYQIPVADRQALLEAEAEDARQAAQDEADDEDEEVDNSDDAEDALDAKAEKPARKRRSRRRGGKKAADAEESGETNSDETTADGQAAEDDAGEETSVEAVNQDNNDADGGDDTEVASADVETADNVEKTPKDPSPETSDEESDDDETTISAENDGDDVVSEPAAAAEEEPVKKPRRRAPRKKKEPATEKTEKEEVKAAKATKAETAEPADEEAPKKPRRRTSRKKKVEEPTEAAAEAETASSESDEPVVDAESSDPAEKPKKRTRRTSRKKAEEPETVEENVADDVAAEAAPSEPDAEADAEAPESEEKPARKTRSRSRSRRRKSTEKVDNEDVDDNNEIPVEDVGASDAMEEVPIRRISRRHYKIQEVIKRRQILLVQVVKEERGNKGAALTTYLSLAGRYSVLMPNTARGGGISRKITNASDRKRLKSIANKLEVPQGMGVILRTAGASRSAEEIQRDFEYLMRLWENVRTLTLESTAPYLVYEEGSLIKRSIRDLYDKDTGEILVAGEEGHREAKDFMTMLMPDHARNVKLYKDRVPMFTRMGVEAQLDAMLQPQVTLKSGGYLIIDQTEALVAIDVNSGRSTRQHSVEDTATQTNLEAADEVARQLRLRDLAGLIVIDFIDMEDKRNIRQVEKRLKDALKNDRARIQVGRISHFGLMEMSRQRIRASVLESTTQTCPVCDGLGHVRSASSIALTVLRAVEDQLNRNSRNHLTVKVSTQTALYLLNSKRESISDLEARFGVKITIEADHTLGSEPCVIERGEISRRKPSQEQAVQPDTIGPEEEEASEAQTQPASETSEGAEGDGRKKRRRRRRRRGGARDEEGDDSNREATGSDEPGSQETDGGDSAETDKDVSEAEAEAVEADERPKKRTTRTRRKKVEAEAEAPVGAAETDDKPEAETESTRPARRTSRPRKSKKADAEVVSDAEMADAPASEPAVEEEKAAEPPRPPRRTTRRAKAAEPVAETTPEPVEEEADKVIAAASEAGSETVSEEPKKAKGGWWQRKFF